MHHIVTRALDPYYYKNSTLLVLSLLLSQFGVPNRIITNFSKSDPYTNFNQKQWHNTIFMTKFLLFFIYLVSK
jgi:hypothetical protein